MCVCVCVCACVAVRLNTWIKGHFRLFGCSFDDLDRDLLSKVNYVNTACLLRNCISTSYMIIFNDIY